MDSDNKQITEQVRDDSEEWLYQGKSRKQVEGSTMIFVCCLIAALFFILLALIANL